MLNSMHGLKGMRAVRVMLMVMRLCMSGHIRRRLANFSVCIGRIHNCDAHRGANHPVQGLKVGHTCLRMH